MQIIAFPVAGPLPFWRSSLAWLALVPLLLVLLSHDSDDNLPGPWKSAQLGYFCGVLFYLGNCYWIYQTMYLYGGLPKVVAAGILCLFACYLGLYHALFASLFAWVRRGRGGVARALMVAPFAWVAVELARARITGFPWDLLGYSQIDNGLMLRIAPWAGVLGLSFVLAALNSLVAYFLLGSNRRKWVITLVTSAICLGGFLLLGRRAFPSVAVTSAQALLLQENLSVGLTARGDQPISLRDEILEFARLTLSQSSSQGPQPTVVVWPEAPSHLRSNDEVFQSAMSNIARHVQAPLIIGSLGNEANNSVPRGYSEFDSAAFFDHAGTYQGRYDKIHLVPWGEYVPYKQFFAFAQKLTEGVGDMDPGSARTLFRADGHLYGTFICYESIFGDEVRQFVQGGAEVLVNISDDGWYGDTGAPWQHLNMARMRAVENHRWVLRDTNTGETTVIDPEGRYTPTERHVRAAYVLPFSFVTKTTFYTRHGDWLGYLCVFVTALALAAAFAFMPRHALK